MGRLLHQSWASLCVLSVLNTFARAVNSLDDVCNDYHTLDPGVCALSLLQVSAQPHRSVQHLGRECDPHVEGLLQWNLDKAVLLSNNLGGLGPRKEDRPYIRYGWVAQWEGKFVDLIIYNISEYSVPHSKDVRSNGMRNLFGVVNVQCGRPVELGLKFVDSESSEEVHPQKVQWSFFDLSMARYGRLREAIEIHHFHSYVVSSSSQLKKASLQNGRHVFAATQYGERQSQPLAPVSLTEEEESRSITFVLSNVSLAARLKVEGGPNCPGMREFHFSGLSQLEACAGVEYVMAPMSTTSTTTMPAMLLLGLQKHVSWNSKAFIGGKAVSQVTSITATGDLDNDGHKDVILSNVLNPVNPLIFINLKNDGVTAIGAQRVGSDSQLVHPGGHFGASIANIGDVNGDGVTDIAVGDPYGNGKLYILCLAADLKIKSMTPIYVTPSTGNGESDAFGRSIAALGDIDGNDVPDLLVGSPGMQCRWDANGLLSARDDRCGGIFLLKFSKDGGGDVAWSSSEVSFNHGLQKWRQYVKDKSSIYFGHAVAQLGDLDGDGISEWAVGAPYDDNGKEDDGSRGAVYVLYPGPRGEAIRHMRKISSDAGITKGAWGPKALFGASVVSPGDLDGDGHADLIVGAPGFPRGADQPAIEVLHLRPDGTVKSIDRFESDHGHAAIGTFIASVGDLDEDGIADLVFGSSPRQENGLLHNSLSYASYNTAQFTSMTYLLSPALPSHQTSLTGRI